MAANETTANVKEETDDQVNLDGVNETNTVEGATGPVPQNGEKPLRLLFVSKTTYDKNATANTLLGEDYFDVSSNTGEVRVSEPRNGFIIHNMPGIMDADVSAKDVEKTMRSHKKTIKYSAIVIVFR